MATRASAEGFKKYGFWLAGYYEDFQGVKCIADDTNVPTSDGAYDTNNTHHGNILNGEATLNPRFRWSIRDRVTNNEFASADSYLLSNKGVSDWSTLDTIRLSLGEKYEGRTRPQFPSGWAHPNRLRYNKAQVAGTTDTYMLLGSGHDSSIQYYIPLGDTDASYGRTAKLAFNKINWHDGDVGLQSSGNDPHYYQTAHLTGCFMGERVQMAAYTSVGGDTAYLANPEKIFYPIKSPAGKPFLNVTTYQKQYNDHRIDNVTPTGNNRPVIACSTPLNSRGDNEYFHIRMCTQAYNGFNASPTAGQTHEITSNIGDSLSYVLKVGFPTNTAFGTIGSNGGTAAIEWTFLPTDGAGLSAANPIGDYHTLWDAQLPGLPLHDSQPFYDLDFKLDYTNNKFKVYHNGTEVTATNTTAGAYSSGYTLKNDTSTSANFLAKNMTGWELFGTTAVPTASEGAIIHTMIDRVALYIPLTDPADGGGDPPPVQSWTCNLTTNSSSLGTITILDDDTEHNLTAFFLDDEVVDWKLLMFSGNIDRPLWQGIIDSVKIKQTNDNLRELQISARDSLGLMDRQMASWEIGQIGLGDSDTVLSRQNEVTKLAETMYLGTAKLVNGKDSIGFESATSYKELHGQRTVTHSSHPIQMYNNEDEYGPNNAENEWLGYSVHGFNKSAGAALEFLVEHSGHGISNGDTVVVYGSGDNDGSYTLASSGGVGAAFSGSVIAATPASGSYVAETSANLLQTKNESPDGVATSSIGWFKFSSQPYRGSDTTNTLKVGDYITMPEHGSQNNKNAFLVIATQTIGGYFWAKTNTGLTTETSGSTLVYSIDKGFIRKISLATDNRNAHSVWMRDLAKSRWFRKHFGIYAFEPEATAATYTLAANITATADKIRVDEAFFDDGGLVWSLTSGVGQIIDADGFVDTFTYLGAIIDDVDGNDYLVGVEGLSKSHASGATIESMKLSDDYKHIWLLWSDMRNDGNASADGGFRKNKFGLLQPSRDNYELDINFVDQFDEQGNFSAYTDLKINSDVDLWEIDTQVDPATEVKFSMPLEDKPGEVRHTRNASTYAISNASGFIKLHASTTTANGTDGIVVGDYIYIFNNALYKGLHEVSAVGSNDITLTTSSTPGQVSYDASNPNNPYFLKVVGSSIHPSGFAGLTGWEGKGGSLLVIDSSKFWNHNTFINSGKSGQDSGTRKTLSDWDGQSYGFPILMDNYWKQATASHENIAAPYRKHENHRKLITEVAELNRSVLFGDTVIETKPSTSLISGFPDFGYGKIKATRSGNAANQPPSSEVFWYAYEGKLDTGVVESATSVTSAAASPYRITCSGADFVNDGVKVGMRVRNVTGKWVAQIIAVGATTIDVTEANILQETGSTRTTVASSDSISIPQQLYNCYLVSDSGNNYTSDEAEEVLASVLHHPTLLNSGSVAEIEVNAASATGTSNAFDEVIIAATVSSRYSLRFLMRLSGYVESPNMGTYWLHDKIRYMWSYCYSNTWLTQSAVPCWYDIGSIPNYYNMTTDGTSSNYDSFGSVVDMRGGKSMLAFLRDSVESTGYGYTNNSRLPITYQIGKDNKLEIRPSYNSGEALTRNSFSANAVNASLGGHITNVRVYYNNGSSFADFPEATLNQTYRWKIIELPEATSRNEALSVAQEEYNKAKTKNIKLQGEVLRDLTFDDKMLSNGRTGYVADVARWCERGVTARTVIGTSLPAATKDSNYCWSSPQSGSLFPGMVSALDGNMKYDAETYKRDRYGKGYETEGTGNGNTMTYDKQHYWWGANSISHAVQMVHIPSTCPLLSQGNNDDLRIFIALKDGQSGVDIDNAEFTIYISDVAFDAAAGSAFTPPATSSGTARYAPAYGVASSATSTLNVKYSGMYEIDIPSSYWSSGKPTGAKFTISVDCDYLRALLRRRCGDPAGSGILHNAHHVSLTGISNFASTSALSLFPLGIRQYSSMTGAYDTRNLWYAPRIHITHDLRWRPATSVAVTDSGVGLSSEPMTIKDIRWSVSGRDIESVALTLERDETKESGGLVSYLYPNTSRGRQGGAGSAGAGSSGGGTPSGGSTGGVPASSHPPAGSGGGGYSGGTTGPIGAGSFIPAMLQGGVNSGLGNGSFSNVINTNNFSSASYANLVGKMDLKDAGTEGAEWGLLGQDKPPIAKNTQRSVEGLDNLITPSSSTATTTEEGFVLPGLVDPDSSDRHTSTQSIKVRVPDDVADEMISVDCTYTMGGTAATIGVMTVNVKCEETGTSKSRTMNIVGNESNKSLTLMGTIPMSGVGVKGNTVKVTVKRTAGAGDDNGSYSSIVIHNIKVNFQRFSSKGKSNNAFKTG